jgi:penicillin-binding protein 2
MPQDPHLQRLLTRRAFIFGGASTAAISVLLGRLYYLQFLRSEELTTLAEDNRIKLQLVAPLRGLVLDRNGFPLATNEKNFRLFLDVETRRDFQKMLGDLSGIIELNPARIEMALNQAKSRRYQPPILIKEHLSWDEVSQFEFYSPDFPGISVDVGQVRHYPFRDHASHLVGYVGTVSEEEMKQEDERAVARLPDFKVGKSGVEKLLNAELRGVAGVKHIEVNVHNLPIREVSSKPAIPGKDIRITVDSRLQEFASQRLEGDSAGVVVMDVHNGDILALVSVPAFDPNRFSLGITNEYWAELQTQEKNPLLNKAISGQYPPGSTFKMLVGLAALEAGVATTSSRVYCPGHFFLGSHQFNCWKAGGHGSVNLHDAIAQSCDTYFYTMAQRLGIDKIADISRKFGLGVMHNIGLVGEKAGIMPDDEWKRARYNDVWRPGDTINAGIGQGYVIATPLQLAVMTARLVNGGKAVKPRLIKPEGEEEVDAPFIGINTDNLKAVMDGMYAVSNEPGGTAYGKRINHPKYSIAGKTGTSQVRKITVRGQDQSKIPWKFRHHAWFVSYAPAIDPKWACAVIVEHGGGGSAAAAPVARDIMLKLQELMDPDSGPPQMMLPPDVVPKDDPALSDNTDAGEEEPR